MTRQTPHQQGVAIIRDNLFWCQVQYAGAEMREVEDYDAKFILFELLEGSKTR